ncbi:MAG: DUF2275 domain-containing protein [Actinobacteria bacterium]|nr:DUF2275 domain-containing protein [Actinomycetota bacterium]
MECEVAREALSARIDGEREPVPSARVDEHVRGCAQCAAWFALAQDQALQLRSLVRGATPGPADPGAPADPDPARPVGNPHRGPRATLAAVGLIQLALAVAQAAGVDFGLVAGHHGAATGAHLLNESTAWSAALGLAGLAAALRPRLAAGLACVAGAYAVVLACYVAADAVAGQVTTARMISHLPVLALAAAALLVWRGERDSRSGSPDVPDAVPEAPAVPAAPASLDRRRRGHLRPTDDSAA